MKKSVLAICILFSLTLGAQNKKRKDVMAIKSMQGCYKVTFTFAETFNYSEDSNYVPSPNKIDYAIEWVDLIEETDSSIVLQHILQAGKDSNAHIIKHWRQDWSYQDISQLMFTHNNTWKSITLDLEDVKGKWTQKVFQVDDSPRYEGEASWIHIDGKSFWENTVDAPLPRRERTIRSDYNVLKRMNRIDITEFGWSHKQDNLKVIRKDNENDFILAKEYGYNSYVRLDDNQCKYAKQWWYNNKKKWKTVRFVWNDVFNDNSIIELKKFVNDKRLWQYLFSDEYQNEEEIRALISDFLN